MLLGRRNSDSSRNKILNKIKFFRILRDLRTFGFVKTEGKTGQFKVRSDHGKAITFLFEKYAFKSESFT